MSEALSISPRDGEAERAGLNGAAALGEAAARGWSGRRRIERRDEVELGRGLQFAYATENIALPTQWTLEHARHTLIVHLDGPMRRLETRIDGAGRLRAAPAAGDWWLIPAGRRYLGRALGGEIAYAELNIDPAGFAESAPGLGEGAELKARMKHRDPFVHGLAARLAHLSEARDDLAAMLRESLGQALYLHLLREHSAGAAMRAAPTDARLSEAVRRRVEDYIQVHLDRRITLDELARLSGLSTHQLLIAFRHAFGMTPIQYVLAQRLLQVCRRLRGGADDIATIAVESGFSSHSHLSAVFKKRYGLTPKEFRLQG
ncbi:helix-turn-helix transcriptional regulator [Lysobacter sp. K5869]|uniref:helix-turn-helix transcriptional regulator n=1 Tax=Lysobacter sp. K5869 TaxID=2820808 RepID=UPI001C05F356|nr:AraC family transcriptional regulator [Lysobacter sp. K5869]QWP79158.1 helix-turn-helix transcriptional regulator [Lysobacter sp. K5869]